MGLIVELIVVLFGLCVALLEGIFWGLRILCNLAFLTLDGGFMLWSLRSGGLTCRNGHRVPTNVLAQCGACGWIGKGALHCGNVECEARSATYIHCPVCRVSVRSYARFGRP